jgi:hypothetical protein
MTDNNGWPGKPGVPLNPERDGWHWRRSCNVGRQPVARYWCAPEKVWQDGPTTYVTIGIASQDYYLGPALTPAEVDARIKEARREALEEAARVAEELIGRPEWPIDELPEDTLRRVIRNCAIPTKSKRIKTEPRWSIVSQVTAHGSTYSAALCRWAGLDPDELVRKRP